jgi:hypothetical protein
MQLGRTHQALSTETAVSRKGYGAACTCNAGWGGTLAGGAEPTVGSAFNKVIYPSARGLEAGALALQRLGCVSASGRHRQIILTLQISLHQIVEDLHRREVVHDL